MKPVNSALVRVGLLAILQIVCGVAARRGTTPLGEFVGAGLLLSANASFFGCVFHQRREVILERDGILQDRTARFGSRMRTPCGVGQVEFHLT